MLTKPPKGSPGEAMLPMLGVASGVAVVWVLGGKTERKRLEWEGRERVVMAMVVAVAVAVAMVS